MGDTAGLNHESELPRDLLDDRKQMTPMLTDDMWVCSAYIMEAISSYMIMHRHPLPTSSGSSLRFAAGIFI